MATTDSGPTRVAGGFRVRDDALRRPRDQLGGGIELTGEDSDGEMWGATIYGPNTADPVVKGADGERVRRIGRDFMANIGPGRSEDRVAGLAEWQRRLNQHYGQ